MTAGDSTSRNRSERAPSRQAIIRFGPTASSVPAKEIELDVDLFRRLIVGSLDPTLDAERRLSELVSLCERRLAATPLDAFEAIGGRTEPTRTSSSQVCRHVRRSPSMPPRGCCFRPSMEIGSPSSCHTRCASSSRWFGVGVSGNSPTTDRSPPHLRRTPEAGREAS